LSRNPTYQMQAATNLQENDISQMQSIVLMYRREIFWENVSLKKADRGHTTAAAAAVIKKYVTSSKNVPARAKEKIWSIS